MTIPEQVKIQGKMVRVNESGRGHVIVGETLVDMASDTKKRICELNGQAHVDAWRAEMYRMFEEALSTERKRVKSL